MGHEDAKTTYKSYIHDRTQDEQKKNLLENALDYQCNQSVIKISSVSWLLRRKKRNKQMLKNTNKPL